MPKANRMPSVAKMLCHVAGQSCMPAVLYVDTIVAMHFTMMSCHWAEANTVLYNKLAEARQEQLPIMMLACQVAVGRRSSTSWSCVCKGS